MTQGSDVSSDAVPTSHTGQFPAGWAFWATFAAFSTYFCAYAFRKPFTAAEFKGTEYFGLDFKFLVVTTQVIGYSLSKFIGIGVIAGMPPAGRARALLLLIGCSELALILFGLLPRPWNILAMFLNGLPLGMVFGLVMGFLEGRRVSEALLAGLCASFIMADGFAKSTGAWLLQQGISEDWMPAAAGALFLLPLTLAVRVLSRTPAPSQSDVAARAERPRMTRHDRWSMVRRFGPGLAAIVLMYLLVTIIRSVRADFATELWKGLGQNAAPAQFTTSEFWVALGVMLANGSLVFVRSNVLAFRISLATCLAGFVLIFAALLAGPDRISPFSFMVLIGLGLYLPYVAVHASVFERLLAMTRERGNVGFLMYVADSSGYLGYVGCMLLNGTLRKNSNTLEFFTGLCWGASLLSMLCVLGAIVWFSGSRLHPAAASENAGGE
ncbi:MAG: DUF5690 family protein [Planctomyces sp.]